MSKKLLALLIMLMLSLTSVPVMAADEPVGYQDEFDSEQSSEFVQAPQDVQVPVVFERTITVTKEGGKYRVGFVTFDFKREFLDKEKLPATFTIKVCVKDGVAGVEVNPSTENFKKDVLIKVNRYRGYLYDEVTGKNIFVNVRSQVLKVEHFSWYRFR